MSQSDTVVMELSPEEQAVVYAMRQRQRNGRGIFAYAMKFSPDTKVDPDADPWRQGPELER